MPARTALLGLAVLMLAGCRGIDSDFVPLRTEAGTVEWREAAGLQSAAARFETGELPWARLALTRGRGRKIIVTRTPDGWHYGGSSKLAGAEVLVEVWEAAPHLPDGTSDLRTARYSARVHKEAGRLIEIVVVDVGTGARLRLQITR